MVVAFKSQPARKPDAQPLLVWPRPQWHARTAVQGTNSAATQGCRSTAPISICR